jgi:TonB family protein
MCGTSTSSSIARTPAPSIETIPLRWSSQTLLIQIACAFVMAVVTLGVICGPLIVVANAAALRTPQDSSVQSDVSLSGTSLRVSLPPNWEAGRPKLGSASPTVLRYKGDQQFEIAVSQFTNWPSNLSEPMELPFECDFLLGAFRNMPDGRTAVLVPRPDYFPDEFYARVLVPQPSQQSTEILACLFLGNSNLIVDLRPALLQTQVPPSLTEMLQAIVEAAKSQSAMLYAPGDINLAVLKLKASLSSGSWGVGRQTSPLGITDLLIRTGGAAELKMMPLLTRGNCSEEMQSSELMKLKFLAPQAKTVTFRKNPPYLSPKWERSAIELSFPPESLERPVIARLQVTVCRQLDSSAEFDVVMYYGSDQISQADAPLIAKALDEISDAVLRGPKGDGVMYFPSLSIPKLAEIPDLVGAITKAQPPPPLASSSTSGRIKVAGNITAGTMITQTAPIYPPLARQARIQGNVILHAIIDRAGKVAELEFVSGHPLLVQAAMDAVRQWRYKPTLLNGDPVEVDTTITVTFTMDASPLPPPPPNQ